MSCSLIEVGESTDVDGRGILTTVPSNVGGIVAGVVVPLVILGIALVFIVTIIFFWHLRRTRLQLTKYSDVRIVCHALWHYPVL